MDLSNLILLIAGAAAGYFYGFQKGRASAIAQRSEPEYEPRAQPGVDHLPGPGEVREVPRPRSVPPPAAAGDREGTGPSSSGSVPPRRTTKPPPAAAGLMDKGRRTRDAGDDDDR